MNSLANYSATSSREGRASVQNLWDGWIGTEATTLILAHGLDTIGLSSISLELLARNPRARAVYDKVGFVIEREFEDDGESWIEMRISR